MIIRSGGIKTMVVAISLLAPLPVAAQTDAGTLPEIEELALTGRADEARAALWLGGKSPGASHREKNSNTLSGCVAGLQLTPRRQ